MLNPLQYTGACQLCWPAASSSSSRLDVVEECPRPPLQRREGVSTLPSPRRISLGARGRAHGMPCDIVAIHQSRYEDDIRLRALYDLQLPGGGRTPEGNGETRAIGLLFLLLHLDRLKPSRDASPPLARFYSHLFRSLFFPATTARSWTSISRGAKEGNERPWGCARSLAAMSRPLEVLPSSSSSF